MVPGTLHELSKHDRLIRDLKKTAQTAAACEALYRRID
jgi:hypothetical protein